MSADLEQLYAVLRPPLAGLAYFDLHGGTTYAYFKDIASLERALERDYDISALLDKDITTELLKMLHVPADGVRIGRIYGRRLLLPAPKSWICSLR